MEEVFSISIFISKTEDFEYLGAMDAQLIWTEIRQNEPHRVEIHYPILEELEPGPTN